MGTRTHKRGGTYPAAGARREKKRYVPGTMFQDSVVFRYGEFPGDTKSVAMIPAKIMIVDDHPLLRQGIRQVIETEEDLAVCAETGRANEAIELVARTLPDLVVVDISLADGITGIELIKTLRERFPTVRAMVLTMHDEAVYAERAIHAGARGYLRKEIASRQIIQAIRAILAGELFFSRELSTHLIEQYCTGTRFNSEPGVGKLTDREFEIFQLVGNGYSTREIAAKLAISIFTVESHKKKMREKLGCGGSPELVKRAIQWVISNTMK